MSRLTPLSRRSTPRARLLSFPHYLGGSDFDAAYGIALDPGCLFPYDCPVYVTGTTLSDEDEDQFPTTGGAFKETLPMDTRDAFVTKLNSTGTDLIYSTFLGGDMDGKKDEGFGIAVDGGGRA